MSDAAWLDAVGQSELISRSDASPREMLDAAVRRIEQLNPTLNAVIHPLFEKAADAIEAGLPEGPLRGVPVLLKDFGAESAGDPYHEGTRFLRDAHWRADADAHLVRRLRQAGCVIVGRTNLSELASAPTTEPVAYGATHNPWDVGRSPGGSSGGSAAAVASGMVAVAHGSDGGGSIRIPASACGLVGLKPSRGRISCGPASAEGMSGMATHFVLTRTVRDAARFLDVLAGFEIGDPYTAPTPTRPHAGTTDPGSARRLRVGLRVAPFAMTGGADVEVDPSCIAAAESAARIVESLGHVVEVASPEELDDETTTEAMATLIFVENARALDYWSARLGRELTTKDVDADNWAMVELGRATSAPAYLAALERIHHARRRIAEWFVDGFDILLTPTMAAPPPPLGYLAVDPTAPLTASFRALPYGTFTIAFNLTGQPALSLPLSWNDDGLPIGVQFVASYGREDTLVDLATQLEQALPWSEQRPPVSAR